VLWLVTNVVGFGLAGAFFHNFPLAFAFPPDLAGLGRFNLMPALLGAAFGFVPALLAGGLQWTLLRRIWPVPRWWIVSVPAGVGLLHFLSDGFENARDLSAAVVLSGLLVGLIQGRLLRPHRSSTRWVALAVLGWTLGWLLGIAVLHFSGMLYRPWVGGLDFQQHGLLGLTTGLAYGLSTGASLVWQPQKREAVELRTP
jgi:hypothetical protein